MVPHSKTHLRSIYSPGAVRSGGCKPLLFSLNFPSNPVALHRRDTMAWESFQWHPKHVGNTGMPDKLTESQQVNQQIQQLEHRPPWRGGVSRRKEPYFSGLSGNLMRSSWFLYDRFSNVRIIFFTELSSSGSSWNKDNSFSMPITRSCDHHSSAADLHGFNTQHTHTSPPQLEGQ